MPRRKNGKKITRRKTSPTKSQRNSPKKVDKEALMNLKSWLKDLAKNDYQHDEDLQEINSDDESDEYECNLKELEKPLNKLLLKYPDTKIRKKVNLECEWGKCRVETTDQEIYNDHVLDHLVPLEDSQLKCLWNLCRFQTENRTEFLRHLGYHAYHTQLKTFGLGLLQTISIPNCQGDSQLRNLIPNLENDYFCHWNGCTESFSVFNNFIMHVNHHLKMDYQSGYSAYRDKNLIHIKVTCMWNDCKQEQRNIYQLKRHLKTHTQEKMIGCPNCGKLYSTKRMFVDHCIRQVVSQRSFQCQDCCKFYASEKLLKDHARSHVNKYQCNLCGLSWQKKSILARHILFRHMSDKPFSCDKCDHKCKTKRDLESHINVHRTGGDKLHKCEVFQCEYSSNTLMALKRHDAREHGGQFQTYQCHCCCKQYKRGFQLSKHLKQDHAFQLAPGHSRFIYKREIDGLYRLQTKRVENLKEPETSRPIVIDKNVDISYEIEKIDAAQFGGTPINVQMKRITKPRIDIPAFQLFAESSTDSKDINDFAIVKNYKKFTNLA